MIGGYTAIKLLGLAMSLSSFGASAMGHEIAAIALVAFGIFLVLVGTVAGWMNDE